MWEKIVQQGRSQIAIWRKLIACWIQRLQTHILNMYYLNLFHCNNCCTNAPQRYAILRCLSCFVHVGFIDYALPIVPITMTHNHFSSSKQGSLKMIS